MALSNPQQRLHRVTLDRPGLTDEWHARLEAAYEQQKQQAPRRRGGQAGISSPSTQRYPSRTPNHLYVNTEAANQRHLCDSEGSAYPIMLDDPRSSASPYGRRVPVPTPYNRNTPVARATRQALGFGWDTPEQDSFANYTHKSVNTGSRHSPYATNAQLDYGHYCQDHCNNHRGRQHPSQGVSADDLRVPRRYVNEANRRWHEEDEDLEADHYMADIMPNAPWRMAHLNSPGAGFGILPAYRDYCSCGATCNHYPASESTGPCSTAGESNTACEDPSTVSHFSDDSDQEGKRISYIRLKKKLKKFQCRDNIG